MLANAANGTAGAIGLGLVLLLAVLMLGRVEDELGKYLAVGVHRASGIETGLSNGHVVGGGCGQHPRLVIGRGVVEDGQPAEAGVEREQ